jgi:hypothetical protein
MKILSSLHVIYALIVVVGISAALKIEAEGNHTTKSQNNH